jgi:hypothetical protein
MPDATINTTAQGTPYLDDNNYVYIYPAYTRAIADRIELLGSPSAAVTALLAQAQAARDAAITAKTAAEAAVASLTATTGKVAFSNSGVTGWYRVTGGTDVEVFFATGSLGTLNSVTTAAVIPAGYRPSEARSAACGGGAYGDRPAAGQINPDGTLNARNNFTASAAVTGYARYRI